MPQGKTTNYYLNPSFIGYFPELKTGWPRGKLLKSIFTPKQTELIKTLEKNPYRSLGEISELLGYRKQTGLKGMKKMITDVCKKRRLPLPFEQISAGNNFNSKLALAYNFCSFFDLERPGKPPLNALLTETQLRIYNEFKGKRGGRAKVPVDEIACPLRLWNSTVLEAADSINKKFVRFGYNERLEFEKSVF